MGVRTELATRCIWWTAGMCGPSKTQPTIPLVALGTIVVATLLIEPDGWAVAVALAAMLLGVLAWVPGGWPVLTLLLQAGIILWKHRSQLAQSPRRRRRAPHPARRTRS